MRASKFVVMHSPATQEKEEYDGKTELRDSSSRSNAAYDTNLPKARLRRKAKTVRQLLGQLYHDLDYVNELMRDIKGSQCRSRLPFLYTPHSPFPRLKQEFV